MSRRPAFTLMEMMVSVAIIGVLAAAVTPKVVLAVRKSKISQCAANRAVIEQAETRYRIEHDKTPSASITELKDGRYLDRVPYCTAGGIYVWVSTSAAVVGCSMHYWPFEPAVSQAPLFSSDFSSMSMIKVLSGKWVIAHDVMKNISDGEARVSFGDNSWKDYSLTLNATLDRGSGYGVYYRADGKAAISGYVFQYDPGLGGGTFLVRKVVAGVESAPIASVSIPAGFPVYDVQHQIQISVVGSEQNIYVDGNKVLTLTDTAFTSGSAGLRTWDSTRAEFDSVTINPA